MSAVTATNRRMRRRFAILPGAAVADGGEEGIEPWLAGRAPRSLAQEPHERRAVGP